VPDPKWGEVGVAVVVVRDGAACDAAALLAHLEGRCARYRWPQRIVFWDALPRSGYGKVVKKDLRELLFANGELWEPAELGKTRESSSA
jgi:acyl-CoA synthetase (AMP-forming)/AMP-acid ligase II